MKTKKKDAAQVAANILNVALKSDRKAMTKLFETRVQSSCPDESQVITNPEGKFGPLGVINAIVYALTGKVIASVVLEEEGKPDYLGEFIVETPKFL